MKKTKKTIIIISVIVLLILVSVGVFFMLHSNGDKIKLLH